MNVKRTGDLHGNQEIMPMVFSAAKVELQTKEWASWCHVASQFVVHYRIRSELSTL
jgi:hypothetical protein